MFNFGKKYTFDDIPLSDVNDLKKRIKIVVIDDDSNSFPMETMQDFGFTLEYWNIIDSKKFKRLENNEFDIIILDIEGVVDKNELGEKDGLDILKSLKNKNKEQIIIAFSGSSYDISKGEFWKITDGFLNKPINSFDTKEMLEEIILTHYSTNILIEQLQKIITTQVDNASDAEKLENLIVKAIKEEKTLDIKKVIRVGIADTSGIMTIFTTLSEIYKKINNE
ncbi:hypothetical protein CRV02_00455 [Arcobacter sp. CECT 8989]|uniref:response regulator transcription factor n=1 Tax=Arcobacter sp. CECT 8989 TaxID=2044509 RepID=UPI00100BDE92|nr:response regulator transcription factor [Arcobacter sp. CECT 8989]RXK03702.1 hypothetical protein CRV02_00455 [Arcobacter sp. CECT 8989]